MITLQPSKIRWYMYLWLWMFKTGTQVDVSTKAGTVLTITVYYKKIGHNFYVVKESFKTREAQGKQARQMRKRNKGH